MASLSAANMPKANADGLKKSFNAKATPSRNGNQLPSFTPANRPTENVHPCLKSTSAKSPAAKGMKNFMSPTLSAASTAVSAAKGMKNFMSPTFSAASKAASSKKRVVVEKNESRLTCSLKSASAKSPASKEMKHFMSPTFSAASKVSSSRKRVLVERNQSKHQIVHPCPPKPASGKSPVRKGMKNFMSSMSSAASTSAPNLVERNSEQKQSILTPYDPIKKNYLSPRPDFLRYRPNRGLDDDVIEVDEGFRKHEFFNFETLSESGDPGEELTTVLPPYDPKKKNFLSPRPKFLRYRPNRSLDDDLIEVDEVFKKHEHFKSETPIESGVTEKSEEIRLENACACPSKSTSKSPVSKGMKNFISSTASKTASSKKRVYAESGLKNVCPSPTSASAKSHAPKGVKKFFRG